MFVSSAAPNKRSLGAMNGLAQTVVSTQRAVGPAAAASLFAFSLQNNILGGQFAYVVLLSLACVGLYVAFQLPRNTWKVSLEATMGKSPSNLFLSFRDLARRAVTTENWQVIGQSLAT